MRRVVVRAVLLATVCALSACSGVPPLVHTLEKLGFPVAPTAVRFAVVGDTGTGGAAQYQVAEQMREYRTEFPFDFVLMLGDNLYGGDDAADYDRKFRLPYKGLLDDHVEFYAALGNHDRRSEPFFKPFRMGGERYHAFTKGNARFMALDSNYLDAAQLRWFEDELRGAGNAWKICFMHHPIYSPGSYHGVDPELRTVLEPLFIKYGVDVVFSGHEHFYERVQPQHGVTYFTSGAGGKLHSRRLTHPQLEAAGYDADRHFMLVEIVGDDLVFRAISRTGVTVDSGVVRRHAQQAGAQPTPSQSTRLGNPFVERAAN